MLSFDCIACQLAVADFRPENIEEEERNRSVVFNKKSITYGMGKSDLTPRPSIRQLKFHLK